MIGGGYIMPQAFDNKQYIIGAKQVMKAMRAGKTSKIYIASDCDPIISRPIAEEAAGRGISVEHIPTRKQLGEMCGIRVKAACAAQIL